MNLLVVDWDYFFPVPHHDPMLMVYFYDWTHTESYSPDFLNALWVTRAVQFISNKKPLPQVQGWEEFSQRFKLSRDCELTYANSNVNAASDSGGGLWPQDWFESVHLFDAHHDSGYGKLHPEYLRKGMERVFPKGMLTCEDWLAYFTLSDVQTHVRYPQWHTEWKEVEHSADVEPRSRGMDDGAPYDSMEFDHVFVCRSDAWVPPWCDSDFAAFLLTFDVQTMTCVDDQAWKPRDFPCSEDLLVEVEQRNKIIHRMNEANELLQKGDAEGAAALLRTEEG